MPTDVLKQIRGTPTPGVGELRIATAVTCDPDPTTFVLNGTEIALDASVFTIPISVYPICKGDTFYVLPVAGSDKQHWGIIGKVNNTNAVGVMTSATACQVQGIGRAYTAADLLIPPYVAIDGNFSNGNTHNHGAFTRPLKAGDRVILYPVAVGGAVKYAIANYY